MLLLLLSTYSSLSPRGGRPSSFLSAAAFASSSTSSVLTDSEQQQSVPVSLDFDGLSFAVGSKIILHSCSGAAAPGRMLAIMGPSGSGKTSLLNALAGQVKGGSSASLTGQLVINGKACGGASSVPGLRVAYVRQEDIFYTQMTVRETLLFAARLRLPASVSMSEKERRVDELIDKLALGKAANTIIGDAKRRGISGGERKRLAIGCELLSDPQLLFLDEPTSGLDAFAAQQVVNSLKQLASRDGTTVIMSIHQPRGSIYNLFDDLLLLADGKVVYCGKASEAASHFSTLGHKCPKGINAGEFVVDLVSAGYDPDGYAERLPKFTAAAARQRVVAAAKAAAAAAAQATDDGSQLAKGARRGVTKLMSSGATQFRLLLKRAWREVARSKAAIAIKVAQQLMIAVIYGGIYSLGDSQSSIQDRFGLLSLVAIGAGNLAIASTIRAFPKEKLIVNSERAKGMYSVAPYFLSKVVAEAPISAAVSALGGAALYPLVGLNASPGKFGRFLLTVCLEGLASGALGLFIGAIAPTTDVALALFPPFLVLMIVFNGFNIAEENAPRALRWIPKVSFIRWCSEGLAVNEFSGLKFSCANSRGPCCETGEQALERVSFGDSTVRGAALSQAKLVAGLYMATLYVLQRNTPKFLSIEPTS